jgi:hypothetical protein
MSTSSPVRTRQASRPPQPESKRSPRVESAVFVVRSILLVVAAVSVIATSNYFAYLIGRKQATYEELRKQVDRVVQLMDQRQVEEEVAATAVKQRQDRLEQNASGLTGLTTSTINGKTTVVAPEPPAERPTPAALIDAATLAPPHPEMRLQPSEASPDAKTKNGDVRGVAQRGPRRHKVPRRPTEALADQSGQTTETTRDFGAAGQ